VLYCTLYLLVLSGKTHSFTMVFDDICRAAAKCHALQDLKSKRLQSNRQHPGLIWFLVDFSLSKERRRNV